MILRKVVPKHGDAMQWRNNEVVYSNAMMLTYVRSRYTVEFACITVLLDVYASGDVFTPIHL